MTRSPMILTLSSTFYSLLLRLCPAGYRREYGAPMAQAFCDLAREAHGRHGTRGLLALWLRVLPDVGTTALAEHIVALQERRASVTLALATAGAQGGYGMRLRLSPTAASALSVGALLAGALTVWPLYILGGLNLLKFFRYPFYRPDLLGIASLPLLFWSYGVTALLSSFGRYLALSAVGIPLALAALRFGRRGRLLLAVEVLTLVGMLAFPCFFRYRPPLVAAPGAVLYTPTQPGLLGGVVKQAQVSVELIPSTYEILGWSEDGVLYYRETVKATRATRVWAFAPAMDARPHIVDAPTGIVPTAVSSREALLEKLRAPGSSQIAEPSDRALALRQGALTSPDERWAAAIAHHIYGPEDVIVIALD